MRYLKRSNSYKMRGNIRQPWSADMNSLLKQNFAKISEGTPLRKPYRYRYNKIFVTENTRKVRVFVWKGIRENTALSSKIHCYVNNANGLDLNRYRSNYNSVRFLLKGQLQN